MGLIHFTTTRSAQALHTIVTSSDEDGSKFVKSYVSPGIELANSSAIPFIQRTDSVRSPFVAVAIKEKRMLMNKHAPTSIHATRHPKRHPE